jgi:hypothetical protein
MGQAVAIFTDRAATPGPHTASQTPAEVAPPGPARRRPSRR